MVLVSSLDCTLIGHTNILNKQYACIEEFDGFLATTGILVRFVNA